jgi:hypothetical protein
MYPRFNQRLLSVDAALARALDYSRLRFTPVSI